MTANAELPELSLPQMLRHNARHRGDRVALRQKDFGIWHPVTWAEYYRRARHVGLGLRALGLGVGGHFAVISENRIEWVIAQMGAGIVRAVTVGVYPTSPAAEVAYVLEHSDAEIVLCEDQEQADKVLEVRDRLPCLRKLVVPEMKGLHGYDEPDLLSFDAVERMGAEAEAREPGAADELLDAQQLADIALMIYTSGSTGKPKGAMISYANIRAAAPSIIDGLGLAERDSLLSYLPLCHVAEQATTNFAPMYLGMLVNFGESLRTVQEDLREVAPTVFLGVPRIWEKLHSAIHIKMLEAGGVRQWLYHRALAACEPFCFRSRARLTTGEMLRYRLYYLLVFRALQNFIGLRCCRVAITGAAPIAPDIVRFFRTIGVPLLEVYGQTETTGVVTAQHPERIEPGTIGEATPGVTLRAAEDGELLVAGGMVFEGYYKNAQATDETIRDGWLHTGDVVEMRDGIVRMVDRKKDIMITAGGKNLSPSEIENTVKASPYIKECVAMGEARKYISALIQIDYDTVAKWAEENGIAYTTFRSLAENPQVEALIDREVVAANGQLPRVAQVKRFALLTKELDHDDDEVTATMKIRRGKIHEKYSELIESLYRDESAA
ncbi:AMP-binding protein [Aquisalimonas lutea]|uniref:AMP-dependent synthetase/ligase n=1 Tax=Aquisalimonas lutea TaxID=1327750 RepID=UPI0025B30CEF|nr:AMP-binding protein [Aquisalimonas lutea]MDN3517631.1 AMP-binding protein [Aquisalimonas lutea]